MRLTIFLFSICDNVELVFIIMPMGGEFVGRRLVLSDRHKRLAQIVPQHNIDFNLDKCKTITNWQTLLMQIKKPLSLTPYTHSGHISNCRTMPCVRHYASCRYHSSEYIAPYFGCANGFFRYDTQRTHYLTILHRHKYSWSKFTHVFKANIGCILSGRCNYLMQCE